MPTLASTRIRVRELGGAITAYGLSFTQFGAGGRADGPPQRGGHEVEVASGLSGTWEMRKRTERFTADQVRALRRTGQRSNRSVGLPRVWIRALQRAQSAFALWMNAASPSGSFVRAALVHEKIVAYRVKRATELLGRPLAENAPHLQVALLLHESLREDASVGGPGP